MKRKTLKNLLDELPTSVEVRGEKYYLEITKGKQWGKAFYEIAYITYNRDKQKIYLFYVEDKDIRKCVIKALNKIKKEVI